MDKLKLYDDLEISKIILGGMPFGTFMSEEEAYEIMDYYIAKGGSTIDTANVYCSWVEGCENRSEETIGKWIKLRNNRKNVQIITKGGHPDLKDKNFAPRLSKEEIRLDFEESLDSLQVDYVDLYLLHRDDENRPVSDIMDTLHSFVEEGKTKAIGVSNWKIGRIIEANNYALKTGKTPLCVSEIQWSLAQCFPETFYDNTLVCMDETAYDEYLKLGMKVIAFSSQAGGVFSCGYKRDLQDISEKHKKYLSEENIRRYNNLLDLCEKNGYLPSSVAIQYITDNKLSAGAIIGCSSIKQLKDSLRAIETKLTFGEINQLIGK